MEKADILDAVRPASDKKNLRVVDLRAQGYSDECYSPGSGVSVTSTTKGLLFEGWTMNVATDVVALCALSYTVSSKRGFGHYGEKIGIRIFLQLLANRLQ